MFPILSLSEAVGILREAGVKFGDPAGPEFYIHKMWDEMAGLHGMDLPTDKMDDVEKVIKYHWDILLRDLNRFLEDDQSTSIELNVGDPRHVSLMAFLIMMHYDYTALDNRTYYKRLSDMGITPADVPSIWASIPSVEKERGSREELIMKYAEAWKAGRG